MSAEWKWPGARWWRVDLHTHTPASHDFQTTEDRENGGWTDWARNVRTTGLDAVGITDHNTASGITELQQAVRDQEDSPVLFPGVEITANDGVHILLLMDPECKQPHVEELLAKVDISINQRGRDTAHSDLSVEQILEKCGDDTLIVGAHVNRPCGILKEHGGQQRLAVLRHRNLAAVEVDPDKEIDESWLDGSKSEIGRKISQIWSSDGHSFDTLGRRFTWVKMTRPNLEGLRLALLDGTASLKPAVRGMLDDPNTHATLAIESITVHKGKFIGRPTQTTVAFNPWLNAIIGGRGTGKSTLIDFCRKTLCREAELDGSDRSEEGSLRNLFERRMSVPPSRRDEGLLTNETRIELVYRKSGERFVLSWSQDGSARPITRLDGDEQISEEGEIRERFPARIYSQKQLFALAQDPNALLTVIDDSQAVRGTEQNRVIEQMGDHYLSLCAQARAASAQASELPARNALLADIRRKLQVLEQGGQTLVLSKYRKRRQQDDTWRAILEEASQAVQSVGHSTDELSVADLDLGVDVEDDLAQASLRRAHEVLRRTVDDLQRGVHARVEQAQRDIEGILKGTDGSQWRAAVEASELEFQEASAQLAEQGNY